MFEALVWLLFGGAFFWISFFCAVLAVIVGISIVNAKHNPESYSKNRVREFWKEFVLCLFNSLLYLYNLIFAAVA